MSKKITMTDIAAEAGVSQTLVSFVLAGKNDMGISTETKRKVLDTARRLGYCSFAASQMLKLGRSGYIILAFSSAVSVIDSEVIDSICKTLNKFGYELVILSPAAASDAKHCIRLVREGRADGILVYGEDSDFVQHIRKDGIPVESVSGDSAESILRSSERLCEVILACSEKNVGTAKKKPSGKKKSVSSEKARTDEQKKDKLYNETSDKQSRDESEKPSKKQESIWLL